MTESNWSKEFALAQQKNRADHLDIQYLMRKMQLLEVEKHVKDIFGKSLIKTAVDIGGGIRGGALFFFRRAERSILIDALAAEFAKLDKLPNHIEPITADFGDIPLPSASVDIVFAWEAFDHANDKAHFLRGIKETIRILKLGGLFFMNLPLRTESREGHPVALSIKDARDAVVNFGILKEIAVGNPVYRDFLFFLVGQKLTDDMNGLMIWTNKWPSDLRHSGLFYTGKGNIVDILNWSPFAWQCKHYETEEKAGEVACHLRNKNVECEVITINKIREYWRR